MHSLLWSVNTLTFNLPFLIATIFTFAKPANKITEKNHVNELITHL